MSRYGTAQLHSGRSEIKQLKPASKKAGVSLWKVRVQPRANLKVFKERLLRLSQMPFATVKYN